VAWRLEQSVSGRCEDAEPRHFSELFRPYKEMNVVLASISELTLTAIRRKIHSMDAVRQENANDSRNIVYETEKPGFHDRLDMRELLSDNRQGS